MLPNTFVHILQLWLYTSKKMCFDVALLCINEEIHKTTPNYAQIFKLCQQTCHCICFYKENIIIIWHIQYFYVSKPVNAIWILHMENGSNNAPIWINIPPETICLVPSTEREISKTKCPFISKPASLNRWWW